MAKSISEGRLRFVFPAGSRQLKYDGSRFYNGEMKSLEMKGVDIIQVDDEHIWLIEIKDYANPNDQSRRAQRLLRLRDLPLTISLKVKDTLAALTILRLSSSDTRGRYRREHYFARQIFQKKVRVALHLEFSGINRLEHSLFRQKSVRSALLLRLRGLLRLVDGRAEIVNYQSLTPAMGWTVEVKHEPLH